MLVFVFFSLNRTTKHFILGLFYKCLNLGILLPTSLTSLFYHNVRCKFCLWWTRKRNSLDTVDVSLCVLPVISSFGSFVKYCVVTRGDNDNDNGMELTNVEIRVHNCQDPIMKLYYSAKYEPICMYCARNELWTIPDQYSQCQEYCSLYTTNPEMIN